MRASRVTIGLTLATVGLLYGSTQAALADGPSSSDEVVNLVMNAPDPLETLDSLPLEQGHEFIRALQADPSILEINPDAFEPIVDEQFLPDDTSNNATQSSVRAARVRVTSQVQAAAATSRFNDIAWKAVEAASCVVDIADVPSCIQVKVDADAAAQAAADEYPAGSLHNDRGDALRHCGWNQRMYIDLGGTVATKVANNHEQDWNSNVPAEKKMDLYNNAQGRAYGKNSKSKASAQDKCVDASHKAKKDYSTPLVIL